MENLKGSEKQLQWAEEILPRVRKVFNDLFDQIERLPNGQKKDEIAKYWEERAKKFAGIKYASTLINLYRDVNSVRDLVSVYNIKVAGSNEEAEVLGRPGLRA